jgi:hypothetical protein
MIFAIVLLIIGSEIGGAAQDMSMLIVGRSIQVSHEFLVSKLWRL